MIYRYRLRDCKENEGISSHQFDGITIHKNRWLYKDKPLNLDRYSSFIETQKAETEEEFSRLEKDKVKSDNVKKREKVLKSQSIIQKSKDELKEILFQKGFTKSELSDLKKIDLKKLIILDEELEGLD